MNKNEEHGVVAFFFFFFSFSEVLRNLPTLSVFPYHLYSIQCPGSVMQVQLSNCVRLGSGGAEQDARASLESRD